MSEADTFTLALVLRASLVGAAAGGLFALVVCAREWWLSGDTSRLARSIVLMASISIPVSVIGFIVGYITATSRTGVVGNLLPALMALLGGLHIYVFGKEVQNRIIVSYLATALTVMVLYGVQHGAYLRDAGRQARLEDALQTEFRIRKMRENLGLPENMPSWGIGVEPK